MNALILDIETVAQPIESFDAEQLKYLDREDGGEPMLNRLALYPLTGRVVTIGLLSERTNAERIGQLGLSHEGEHRLLEWFWEAVCKYDQIVTFNGRGFDIPFLLTRSRMLGVSPSRNDLMGNRFSTKPHCDLLEQLSFYGATRKFSLDFTARAFGLAGKSGSGKDVGALFAEGRYQEIVDYNSGDLKATVELWRRVMG